MLQNDFGIKLDSKEISKMVGSYKRRKQAFFQVLVLAVIAVFLVTAGSNYLPGSGRRASASGNSGITLDLAQSSSYNFRFDGAAAGDYFGHIAFQVADLDGDGKNDLILNALTASNEGRTKNGSMYIFYNDLLQSFGQSGTIDMADSSNFSLRIDGEEDTDSFSDGVTLSDLDGDGKLDILATAGYSNHNGFLDAGSVYVINNKLFASKKGPGDVIDLADHGNFNVRFDGPVNIGVLANGQIKTADIDGDGRQDVMIESLNNANGSKSGSLYIIYNTFLQPYMDSTGKTFDTTKDESYNIRFDGITTGDSLSHFGNYATLDYNNDSKTDLSLGCYRCSYGGRTMSGSVFLIDHDKFSGLSGTGNKVSMANQSNYNIRIVGPTANSYLGGLGNNAYDIDNNGKKDLILSSYYAGNDGLDHSGSVFVIKDQLLSSFADGSVVDLINQDNFDLRIDGGLNMGAFGFTSSTPFVDYNLDGKIDMLIEANNAAFLGRTSAGVNYLIDNSTLNTSAAKVISMTDSNNYLIKFGGPEASFRLGYISSFASGDINNDGLSDILIGGIGSFNGRTNSGSVYAILNFPHTISVRSMGEYVSGGATIGGSVEASNSVTDVSKVEYRVDGNSQQGDWQLCNGTNDYECDLESLADGSHTVYIRAVDSLDVATSISNYKTVSFVSDSTPPSGSILINSGDSETFSDDLSLSLSASDQTTNVAEMQISNSSEFDGAEWESYSQTKGWEVSSGYGEKTVYVRFKDSAGNVSPIYSDTISYVCTYKLSQDSSIPEASETSVVSGNDAEDETSFVDIEVLVVDANSSPISGATVSIYPENKSEKTNNDGITKFSDIEVGSHKMLATYKNLSAERDFDVDKYDNNIKYVIQLIDGSAAENDKRARIIFLVASLVFLPSAAMFIAPVRVRTLRLFHQLFMRLRNR